MNEPDIENELRGLVPAAPSARLATRIAHELSEDCGERNRFLRANSNSSDWFTRLFPAFGWATIGAAAALTALAVVRTPGSSRTIPQESAPVAEAPQELGALETSRELIGTTEEDLLLDPDQEPARRVRFTSIERHTWTDDISGGRIEVEIPREDVLLMPVAMQ